MESLALIVRSDEARSDGSAQSDSNFFTHFIFEYIQFLSYQFDLLLFFNF